MLGWALNKATGNASSNAPPMPGPDDTFVEQPDTPAPVFAARAFKRALFGTPAPTKEAPSKQEPKADTTKLEKTTSMPVLSESNRFESPTKPQGILLTPGTGTSRRKRVSFGRDVTANAGLLNDGGDGGAHARPRTKLQEALERSRKRRDARYSVEDDARKLDFDPDTNDDYCSDDAWEEVDELDRDTDITVDLNEPRSQSGRYWKGEFQKYHEEARAEMEKLVKYKQLAKSYAKAKDAEALDLNERLREEQVKVTEMEKKLTELAGQIGAQPGKGGGARDDRKLAKDLTRQTALAAQYRNQVDELEALLKDSGYGADENGRRREGASSRTGREQGKELGELRQALQQLKSDLNAVEQREKQHEVEKKELERKLSRKDTQYDKLKLDYDALKDKNKALRDEIAELKRGPRASKLGNADLLREDLQSLSAGQGAPSPWTTKLENLQSQLDSEQEARRREMEDASVTINQLRSEFKKASEQLRSPVQRKSSAELRAKPTTKAASRVDDDTFDLLQSRRLASTKGSETPLGRSITPRGSKRTMSGRVVDNESSLRERATPRSVQLARMANKNRLRLATERALDSESDPELKPGGMASTRDAPLRSAISSDRRAAAIARLEQKRAERRKARERTTIIGKENMRP
ncbi:hypothetical protein M406DRAFT_75668 [Cryphonectria parasitica EP155]|uniref:Spindle pole body-associated protein cut12 domain-containing protein n=1 Tax=Cryphonectria parasitica (strain ATCC 38755 / EP155) TaxID=660469 RepID=A0A9P5CJI0_CRYP1|nr:uncharacterized protein M406DRAFT_75668 [Cryphonectria parasitica EP155]KAF3760172.1 hypothetical protein M406DRAFT_75668 [Cryphonectria parasitica EP155]